VHFAVEHRIGRFVTRHWLKTRINPQGWQVVPVPPAEAAAKIAPVPLLIVHGDQDPYFPPEHARQLYLAAREPKELWLIPGMGHAETASGNDLIDRIARWLDQAVRPPATPTLGAPTAGAPTDASLDGASAAPGLPDADPPPLPSQPLPSQPLPSESAVPCRQGGGPCR
jgi:hypothetical protein